MIYQQESDFKIDFKIDLLCGTGAISFTTFSSSSIFNYKKKKNLPIAMTQVLRDHCVRLESYFVTRYVLV